MEVNILINGVDVQSDFGVCLEDGGVDAPQLPATPKQPFYNEWEDSSGRDYDTTTLLVYQAQTLELPFLIIANNMEDYKIKKLGFLNLVIKNVDLVFYFSGIDETLKIRYVETVSWDFINLDLDSQTSARFVMRFEKNHRA